MTSEEAAMEVEGGGEPQQKAVERPTFNVGILELVKTTQAQRGIRQGDFLRYRQFLSRKLHRMRKQLKITNGRGKFQKKALDLDKVNCVEHVLVHLWLAERAWAYAMELREETEDVPRRHFHMMRRLRKSVKHAEKFLRLLQIFGSDAMKVEGEAYLQFLSGTLALQSENWNHALQAFLHVRATYQKLLQVSTDDNFSALCRDRIEEVEPSIRFCQYNLEKEGQKVDLDDRDKLIAMQVEAVGGISSVVKAKVEGALARERKVEEKGPLEVEWRGKKVPVSSEKLKDQILRAQQLRSEIGKEGDADRKLMLYDRLFVAYTDGRTAIKDQIKDSEARGIGGARLEELKVTLDFIDGYINEKTLLSTVERNELLVHSMRARLPKNIGVEETFSLPVSVSKKSRPSSIGEIVRMCEILSQTISQLDDLPSIHEDDLLARETSVKGLLYKALRCAMMADAFASQADGSPSWNKALALNNRAREYLSDAESVGTDGGEFPSSCVAVRDDIALKVQAQRSVFRAKAFLEVMEMEKQKSEAREGETEEERGAREKERKDAEKAKDTVANVLHSYEEGAEAKRVTEFPPPLSTVGVKPVVFDLAYPLFQYRNLDHRKPKKGLFGFFR